MDIPHKLARYRWPGNAVRLTTLEVRMVEVYLCLDEVYIRDHKEMYTGILNLDIFIIALFTRQLGEASRARYYVTLNL